MLGADVNAPKERRCNRSHRQRHPRSGKLPQEPQTESSVSRTKPHHFYRPSLAQLHPEPRHARLDPKLIIRARRPRAFGRLEEVDTLDSVGEPRSLKRGQSSSCITWHRVFELTRHRTTATGSLQHVRLSDSSTFKRSRTQNVVKPLSSLVPSPNLPNWPRRSSRPALRDHSTLPRQPTQMAPTRSPVSN
jgi:hypothetical protein